MVLQQNILSCLGLCDQRQFGGELKCCRGKDPECYVKVKNTRQKGTTPSICYCDSYCLFTEDCCEDYPKAVQLCSNPRPCKVSKWGKWNNCNTDCGIGSMTRTRKIIQYPLNGGTACPALKQTRGCNRVCNTNNYATILPILYRRPVYYGFEEILPAPLEVEYKKEFRSSSFCVYFKLTNKRDSCQSSWARTLNADRLICVECQSRVMVNGHCRGEGQHGIRTRWKALGVSRCHGDWVRFGEIEENCVCNKDRLSNFVFV